MLASPRNNTGIIFLMWLMVMGTPAFFADHTSPWFLVYTFGSIAILAGIAGWWYTYIKKGDENV